MSDCHSDCFLWHRPLLHYVNLCAQAFPKTSPFSEEKMKCTLDNIWHTSRLKYARFHSDVYQWKRKVDSLGVMGFL